MKLNMYFPQLKKLSEVELFYSSPEDVLLVDNALASQSRGGQISPWRISKKTGLAQSSVYEILNLSSNLGITRPVFLLWCPETRITIDKSYSLEDLDMKQLCPKCEASHQYNESDIYVVFELIKESESLDIAESPLKKKAKVLKVWSSHLQYLYKS